MRKIGIAVLCVAAVAGAPARGMASAITVDVFPSSAPNVFGSPSWGGYVANAIQGIGNGGATTGDRQTSPTGYESGSSFQAGDMIVTSFPVWRGEENPAAPFESELGNRMHFGLHVLGNGEQFSLSELHYDMNSSDPGNTFDFDGAFDGSDVYSATRWGIIYKPNGPPTVLNAGQSASTLVDELIYVGIGNGLEALSAIALSDSVAFILGNGPFHVSTRYWLERDGVEIATGEGVATVPEPSVLALVALGLAGVGVTSKRRSRLDE